MKLPPIHNKRSPEQWRIISEHVDFKDKAVLDLGCGYSDILFRCWQAGTSGVTGIDSNSDILQELADFAKEKNISIKELFLILLDLNYVDDIRFMFMKEDNDVFTDITICFSVLPYLLNPIELLKWMKQHSTISLIECQYFGDGIATPPSIFGARSGKNGEPIYGMYPVENDMEMRMLLEQAGWKSIEPIGKTLVKDRNKYRTIWACQ